MTIPDGATGLQIGANVEASADLSTAGDKVLALHELIDSDIDDAEFRRRASDLLGPKP